MRSKPTNPPVEVNLEELDRIIDGGMHAPLSEADGEKLKNALHAFGQARGSAPTIHGEVA